MLYVFEHKMQYLLIHAPYTCLVVFWHMSNMYPYISYSQICYNTLMFCIATFCEILLYDRQLVVITYVLIDALRAVHR